MSSDSNKKYKKPKRKTLATTDPETSTSRRVANSGQLQTEHDCPLLAKDSEWVDILQTSEPGPAPAKSANDGDAAVDKEEVLQLVECEDGPQMKPLAIMFPGLLDKDPLTLDGMLNRGMSTTEVTRQLVDLGQKANFAFMKKADRLIPTDKEWLESVKENSNSMGSLGSSAITSSCFSSSYEASDELTPSDPKLPKKKKKPNALSKLNPSLILQDAAEGSNDMIDQEPSSNNNKTFMARKSK